ncbi:MAG: alpha-mannosidase [Firmicutes bacterium]|nr:alpha-mannosidase [Bacillota bacterium]HQD38937.1 alpha-mannosidase [Bacillota bacterium]
MYLLLPKLEKRIEELGELIYDKKQAITVQWSEEEEPAAYAEVKPGLWWGGRDQTVWFRGEVKVPEDFSGKLALAVELSGLRTENLSGPEALLFFEGEPVGAIDKFHREVVFPKKWQDKDEFHFTIKAFSGLSEHQHRFDGIWLVRINPVAEDLYYTMWTVRKAVLELDENDPQRVAMLSLLEKAELAIDWRQKGSAAFYSSLENALAVLKEGLKELPAAANSPVVVGAGHSHIDVAWLWQLKHTVEKCSRTFSTVLNLMEQYPEYYFTQSQPQLYQYTKDHFPGIYAKIKEKVEEGRWEPTGAMWVEADCNVSSGESLVRQLLYGIRFFEQEFGKRCKVLWLPDAFGYNAALPQLLKQAGIESFMTTKISWSQYNRFPYDTFMWRGIDGSEILTHFITTPVAWEELPFYTYNGDIEPSTVKGIWDNYRQKALNQELLLSYGWGDGGGGPTRQMLEVGRRLRNLAGFPRFTTGKAEEYFAKLHQTLAGKELPVWDDELYLELHRGTLTSQAATKRNNRKSELLLRDVEAWSLISNLAGGVDYPQAELEKYWKLVLLNQFHDILPGSSITEVYQDSEEQYREVKQWGEKAVDAALAELAAGVMLPQRGLVVFNSLGWQRRDLIALPWQEEYADKHLTDLSGRPLQVQVVNEGGEEKLLVEVEAPPFGYNSYLWQEGKTEPAERKLKVAPGELENDFFKITLNDKGQLTSVYDKTLAQEVLAGPGNLLEVYEDKPLAHDAWDIDAFHMQKRYVVDELIEAKVEEEGPIRGVLKLVWKFLDSTITQRLVIYSSKKQIDFQTEVDWHQQNLLLKAAFPVEVRARMATYDIQFGTLQRPTHWNTSWDFARFEVCGHKWADLSEQNWGVSLLNDCKYGYQIKDNWLRLTLIKSATYPDPEADQGFHQFTYSLYPHKGTAAEGGTVRAGYELNVPLRYSFTDGKGSWDSHGTFLTLEPENIIVETIKQAEDSDALIVRLYESAGARGQGTLNFIHDIASAKEVNLLEEPIGEAEFSGSELKFSYAPYQVKTFAVTFK